MVIFFENFYFWFLSLEDIINNFLNDFFTKYDIAISGFIIFFALLILIFFIVILLCGIIYSIKNHFDDKRLGIK